jgi:CubicO group peptidase (beta-lactamase class C family)
MSPTPRIEGTCDARFNRVRDALAESFSRFGETGASLALTIDNKPVVDLWAGYADGEHAKPWPRDAIANVYSTTKGMTAICALRLVSEGRLDLDAPVARYWPEFGQAGKEQLPVRYLLSHRAGLPAVSRPLPPEAMYQWDVMSAALAEQAPWWEPGTRHGYHALTYGWLVGEVVRRITGRSLGKYFREELAEPLGIDFHIGLGPEHDARVAPLILPPAPLPGQTDLLAEIMKDLDSMLAKTFINPPIPLDEVNTRAWRAAEIPAANGHTNARALARIYGALGCGGTLDGKMVMSPASIELGYTMQSDGIDAVLPLHTTIGLGFFLSTPTEKLGPNPRSFGHGGMGGSLGFADPDARLGFGYVMNEMHTGLWLIDPRAAALIGAVYECL